MSGTTMITSSCGPVTVMLPIVHWLLDRGRVLALELAGAVVGKLKRDRAASSAIPIVATSTITRGALNSRRMIEQLDDRARRVPTSSAKISAGKYGQPAFDTQIASTAAAGTPRSPTAKLMIARRAVDEHDAHRDQRDDQARDEADEEEVGRPDVGLEQRPR